jgi:hypothetical protein
MEEVITVSDRRNEQVRPAIIVDVGKTGRHANLVRETHSRGGRNVLEPPATQVSPQFAFAELVYEIEVYASIAVDVRRRQAVSMIIVDGLVVARSVIDRMVLKPQSTGVVPVGKREIMKSLPGLRGLSLESLIFRQGT